jgi:hypothetical protein
MLDNLPPREPYRSDFLDSLGRWYWLRGFDIVKPYHEPSDLPPELFDRMRDRDWTSGVAYATRQEAIDHLEATIKSLPASYQEIQA